MIKRTNTAGLLLMFLIITVKIKGQQDPLLTMYLFDKTLINPAYAGSSPWAVTTAKYRQQFVGMDGRPVTQTLNFHAPIQKKHIGLGVKIVNDKIAIVNNLNAAMQLSYHLNFFGGKLSAGLEAGIYNRKINFQNVVYAMPNDNSLAKITQSSLVPDLSAGLFYQKKQFYMGYSCYHLLNKDFNFGANGSSAAKLYKHQYLLIGNTFFLSKHWDLESSVLLKAQSSIKPQMDICFITYYKEKFGFGLQTRDHQSVSFLLRFLVTENIKIAYSYDQAISSISRYFGGAHEIVISYGVKLPPPPSKKEIHPRYYF